MAIKLSIGRGIDPEAIEVTEEFLASNIRESLWRNGTAIISNKPVACQRKQVLDEYEYRIGTTVLYNKCIEAWNATEYMEWRDS